MADVAAAATAAAAPPLHPLEFTRVMVASDELLPGLAPTPVTPELPPFPLPNPSPNCSCCCEGFCPLLLLEFHARFAVGLLIGVVFW